MKNMTTDEQRQIRHAQIRLMVQNTFGVHHPRTKRMWARFLRRLGFTPCTTGETQNLSPRGDLSRDRADSKI